MHHFDVRREGADFIVERSSDGAGWGREYITPIAAPGYERQVEFARWTSEALAKAMRRGVELAGGDARVTSGGREL